MAKSKKRRRTQALYEAARKAKAQQVQQQSDVTRVEHEHGNEHDPENGNGNENGTNEITDDHSSNLDPNPSQPHQQQDPKQQQNSEQQETASNDDLEMQRQMQITIRTLQSLTRTPQQLEIFRHSHDYKDLRRAIHPLVVEQMKNYDKGMDYRTKVTVHLSRHQWNQALSSLQACHDLQQLPKQGTIQRWVRDVDQCTFSSSLKIQLLTSILTLSNHNASKTKNNESSTHHDSANDEIQTTAVTLTVSTTSAADVDLQTTTAPIDADSKDKDDEESVQTQINTNNKHDPLIALRLAQEALEVKNKQSKATIRDNENANADLVVQENWKIPSSTITIANDETRVKANDETKQQPEDTTIMIIPLVSKIIYKEEAKARKPPNHYDLWLHATLEPSADLVFDDIDIANIGNIEEKGEQNNASMPNRKEVIKHEVPFVSGGFVLQNVFSPTECQRLKQAATQLGYRPDHPTNLNAPTGIDSCEWLVDDSIHDILYQRVQPHLPPSMQMPTQMQKQMQRNSSHSNILHSINRRWRFFRYGKDCVYRPHIDGSWPESRLIHTSTTRNNDTKNGNNNNTSNHNKESNDHDYKYECDETGQTKSFFTFLMYLNDDFEGGETRFYQPSANDGDQKMVARGIVPQTGSVVVFPQGNTASLLHEGSAVRQGIKYVIRSDVLYQSNNNTSSITS